MREEILLLWRMPWKHKGLLILVIALCTYIGLIAFDTKWLALKYALFLLAILAASLYDLQTRTIPDWIHVAIIIIGLIDFNLTRSIAGLLLSPLPFLIMAVMQSGSVGGGDIKLIGASGFILGVGLTTMAAMISIGIVACFYTLYYLSYKKAKCTTFPFAPFFQVGCMIVIVCGGIYG